MQFSPYEQKGKWKFCHHFQELYSRKMQNEVGLEERITYCIHAGTSWAVTVLCYRFLCSINAGVVVKRTLISNSARKCFRLCCLIFFSFEHTHTRESGQLSRYSDGYFRSHATGLMGFGVDRVALGRVSVEYLGFPRQFSFHQLLHFINHPIIHTVLFQQRQNR
jgi:hypothetical protein